MHVGGALASFGLLFAAAACGARSDLPTGRDPGSSDGSGGGAATRCFQRPSFALRGTIRDFDDDHPDFEAGVLDDDRGIVKEDLGEDGLPVYASGTSTTTTHGRAAFDQWFRDVDGVNLRAAWSERLEGTNALVFSDDTFFPIDGQLLGNQGREHDFHFTLEAHAELITQGGEVLRFQGDDDLWVFIDERLALDLGGVHSTEAGVVALDDLDLARGRRVPLDLFFAERQTSGSTFSLTLSGFALCED